MTGKTSSRVRKLFVSGLGIAAVVGVYCLATVGVSSLLMTTTDMSALAKGGHGHGPGGHGPHGHVGHGHMGPHGHGGHAHRHFYHGRWWAPGVGPCWQWTPVGWVWICG